MILFFRHLPADLAVLDNSINIIPVLTGVGKSSIPRLRDAASGRRSEFTQPWN